jgi:hypothetical protein
MNEQLMNYSEAYRHLWESPEPPAEVAITRRAVPALPAGTAPTVN